MPPPPFSIFRALCTANKNGFKEVTEKLINDRLTGLETDKMDDVILKGYIQIKCSNPGRLKRKVSLWT